MPLGDADMAVFFSDFGVPVAFGSQSARGLFDAPGKDAIFDRTSVSDTEYRLELAASAFIPFPDVKARLTVNGSAFAVNSATPLDDGATVELKLRKL